MEIRESIKRLFEGESHFPLGWWVGLDGRVFDVSRDLGPGDHMGYVWAGENGKELGLSQDETDSIALFYLSDGFFSRESLENMLDDPSDPMHEYIEVYERHTPKEWSSLYQRALQSLYSKWIRVLYHKRFESVYAQVASKDQIYHDALVQYLYTLGETHEISRVTVETYEEKLIWSGVSASDAFMSKSFNQRILVHE